MDIKLRSSSQYLTDFELRSITLFREYQIGK